MNEVRVESTTLRALAYDGGRGILQLEFCTRAIYQLLWRSCGGL